MRSSSQGSGRAQHAQHAQQADLDPMPRAGGLGQEDGGDVLLGDALWVQGVSCQRGIVAAGGSAGQGSAGQGASSWPAGWCLAAAAAKHLGY